MDKNTEVNDLDLLSPNEICDLFTKELSRREVKYIVVCESISNDNNKQFHVFTHRNTTKREMRAIGIATTKLFYEDRKGNKGNEGEPVAV